mmetsp:Transcript_9722/g.16379  ORF Transcript_9722/g.16379 Transcript_9722/m.16379 type:complete len:89 (+) Transcript_9722:601-867(+)
MDSQIGSILSGERNSLSSYELELDSLDIEVIKDKFKLSKKLMDDLLLNLSNGHLGLVYLPPSIMGSSSGAQGQSSELQDLVFRPFRRS